MTINDTALLEVIGTVGGQQHIHTIHFRYDDALSSEQGLIDAWQAGGRTAYRACFSNTDEPVQLLRARQVCGSTPLRAPVEEAEAAGNRAGTINYAGAPRSPSWLAAVTNHRTAFAGPSRRGRSFLGGLYQQDLIGNDLVAAMVTIYEAYWAAMVAWSGPSGTSTYTQVVHSPKLASVPGAQCQDSSTIITSHQVVLPVATMKSRKPGSGS